jgi:phosphoribosylaminoimidazole-succinocarboxamide synthase
MNFAEIAAALPARRRQTSIDGLPFPRIASGKVREIFDLGDALLLVATDRLSAFDVILPDGIPGKGIILTQMSNWWFEQTAASSEPPAARPAGELRAAGSSTATCSCAA